MEVVDLSLSDDEDEDEDEVVAEVVDEVVEVRTRRKEVRCAFAVLLLFRARGLGCSCYWRLGCARAIKVAWK